MNSMPAATSPSESARENLPPPWLSPAPAAMLNPGPPGPAANPSPPGDLVLVFASTTEVLNAEDWLEMGNYNFALIPVPKEVNPNCGLALRVPEESAPEITRALARAGFSPVAVYRRLGGKYNPFSAGAGLLDHPEGPPAAP